MGSSRGAPRRRRTGWTETTTCATAYPPGARPRHPRQTRMPCSARDASPRSPSRPRLVHRCCAQGCAQQAAVAHARLWTRCGKPVDEKRFAKPIAGQRIRPLEISHALRSEGRNGETRDGRESRSTGQPDNGGPPRPGRPDGVLEASGPGVRGRRRGGTPSPLTRSHRLDAPARRSSRAPPSQWPRRQPVRRSRGRSTGAGVRGRPAGADAHHPVRRTRTGPATRWRGTATRPAQPPRQPGDPQRWSASGRREDLHRGPLELILRGALTSCGVSATVATCGDPRATSGRALPRPARRRPASP